MHNSCFAHAHRKSGIAKGVRSTVNDPATRPEEEARAPQSWMHLAPPARPWLKRLVAFNESVTTAFLKCHIDVKRCPSGSEAASMIDCFFTSACASSARLQRGGHARKEVDACRFRACAALSDRVHKPIEWVAGTMGLRKNRDFFSFCFLLVWCAWRDSSGIGVPRACWCLASPF